MTITVTVTPKIREYVPEDFPPQRFEFTGTERTTAEAFAQAAELEGYAVSVVLK